MPTLEPSAPEDLPPASVELDALKVVLEAFIAVEGREKGQRMLSEIVHILALREETETVVEFLPPKQLAARTKVRRQTAAWFRRSLPTWITRLTAS
jgi:hypothetical protein